MNSYVREHFQVFRSTQAMRDQLMDILTDEDLAFTPGGHNPSLGALCRESGEVQAAYTQSLKNHKLDFSYRNPDPALESSVQKLAAWLQAQDHELRAIIEGLSEEDLGQPIDRGGWSVPAGVQLHIYREALLIFYGKACVYLKAMGRPLPEQWQAWIG